MQYTDHVVSVLLHPCINVNVGWFYAQIFSLTLVDTLRREEACLSVSGPAGSHVALRPCTGSDRDKWKHDKVRSKGNTFSMQSFEMLLKSPHMSYHLKF